MSAENAESADITVVLEYVSLPGGAVYVLPSEEAIDMQRWRADEVREQNPQLADAYDADALKLAKTREKHLAKAQQVVVKLKKPTYAALTNAKLKHSTMNQVTGTAQVNPVGLMKEILPQCVMAGSKLPDDPTLSEIVENRLYEVLYPSQEKLDFLLSR